jgi:thymidylate synthase
MKNGLDEQYINLLKDILENGIEKNTRNGKVLSVFGRRNYELSKESSEEKQIKSLKEQLKLSQNTSDEMIKKIQSLIDMYNTDISKLEEEFRDSSSILTLEKIVTLQSVVNDLESKLNKY